MRTLNARYLRRVCPSMAPNSLYCGSMPKLFITQLSRNGRPTFIARRGYATADSRLDLVRLDAKWQKRWEERNSRTTPNASKIGNGQQKYVLPMFPYPSGDLHLGHLRVYTISDTVARFQAMQGYDIMHPIGFDAFGLPAENAAIERGTDPAIWTQQNMEKMRAGFRSVNAHWDWDRELSTCDPSFYKHTQRIFLLLHERGLAYQAISKVNYDPIDKTVLANEQVDANGRSWRSGAKVEQRELKQWFLKISEFRDALLDDIEYLSKDAKWPERVLTMQKNWIGKSVGAKVQFPTLAYGQSTHGAIEVFTTRPDTLFGVQYIALSSDHPIVRELSKRDFELEAFLDTIPALPSDSKIGYLLPDVRAINPLAYDEKTPDATKASIPIYVAPYVLGDYGHGAVMGVPGHDIRDHHFWKHNRGADPIRTVISGTPDEATVTFAPESELFTNHGTLTESCGPYAGQTTAEATENIIKMLEANNLGTRAETWRLRDWLISRQRYWGTPIPIIHCDSCGPVPVPEEELPVELPNVESHWLKGRAGNPLETAHDWVNVSCPKCHAPAKRDTDTMDTFVDSSWYFMRFPDSKNKDLPFSPESAATWMPVDCYVGGVEHAILHLLYSRFITKFLATTSLWPADAKLDAPVEPFKQVLTQGMVHGKTYSDTVTGKFLKPSEVDLSNPSKPIVIATGEAANVSYEKMSKSKYNGVPLGDCLSKYGADATRAHMLFQAPVTEVLEWDEERIAGITRWLRRLHDFVQQKVNVWEKLQNSAEPFNAESYFTDTQKALAENKDEKLVAFEANKALWHAVQLTILSVTESYGRSYSLNTVVSDLMSLTNTIIDTASLQDPLIQLHATQTLLQMMAPITPAFAEECWEIIASSLHQAPTSVFDHLFPQSDGTLEMLAPSTQPCAVQINGKLKFAVDIPIPPAELSGNELSSWVTEQLLRTEEGKTRLGGGRFDVKKARKVIVVRGGKTINFVL
ncbi:leucyl-tRNA synthetase [Xylogone sp. PMI_703]|nr:leucyl-tRNA synthetase [Xylogone sp. PMI_703]